MAEATQAVVHLKGDTRGTADRRALEGGEAIVAVALEDGRTLEAPAAAFSRRADGSYELPISLGIGDVASSGSEGRAAGRGPSEAVIPILAEEAMVSRREVETGRVRIHKTVRERQETVDTPLVREEVEVRRVAVDRAIDGPAEIRHEGDTLIIPVVEEVLVVTKALRVREELHVTRRRVEDYASQTVTLRREEATVERTGKSDSSIGPGAAQEPR